MTKLLEGEAPVKQPTSMFDLLALAINNESAIDVIERLGAMQEKAVARDAEIQFNEAMNLVQSELGRIAPDLNNPQTRSKYASYAKLDKILRPIYVKHGFSLSFNTAEPTREDVLIVLCYVSHSAGHTRTYRMDMPSDGKGAKGGDVMTKTHATGSAMQYGMRYLLKSIFNIAVGTDDDGNAAGGAPLPEDVVVGMIDAVSNCNDLQELMRVYKDAYKQASDNGDQDTMKSLIIAKDKRKKELASDSR